MMTSVCITSRAAALRWWVIVALLSILSLSGKFAKADAPPIPNEDQKLQVDPASISATKGDGAGVAVQSGSDLFRVLVALGAVIGLILVLKKFATKSGWFAQAVKQGRSIRVISRQPLSPRQQVVVLQIGKRLIVVGDSAGTLTALAQITEPDEVAALIGEADSAPATAGRSGGFAGIFKRANQPFDATVTADELPALARRPELASEPEAPVEDVGGLLEAVRAMRRQFKQT